MAKNGTAKRARKSRKDSESELDFLPTISPEVTRGVAAVFSIALCLFLTLAGFGVGGAVGSYLFTLLSSLLGVGYLLLPLSFLILAIGLIRSYEQYFGALQVVSVVIFLLSSLAFIDLIIPGKSGVVGSFVARPLVSLIDPVATGIFLVAFIFVALIIAFNIHIGAFFARVRDEALAQKDRLLADSDEKEVTIAHMDSDEAEEGDEAEEDPVAESEDKPAPAPRQPRIQNGVQDDEVSTGFPIIAARASTYTPPPLSLLGKNKGKPEVGDVKANMNLIKRTLQNFGIQVEMDEVSIGPTVTRYAMKPAEGVRLSKIVALQSNLELALAASPIRIEAPIPGKSLVGIEVPNVARTTLGLAPLLSDPQYTQSEKPLLIGLGRNIAGQALFADLARMPHMLVAGTTGAGKSVTIHDFILSLIYRCGPERLRFIMVDPKRVELTLYNSIPHLLTPVITDPKKAIMAIKWLGKEMERRYNILETEKVRDIASYHENVVRPALEKSTGAEGEVLPEAMPYIAVFIDELADIMSTYPRELEAGIVRLAQMSRAIGIHLILSTQRPSVKVITGLIKANVPSRVALQVASQIDSRTILDSGGAEKLLGAGDMLFLSGEMSKPARVQAPYTSEAEVKRVVQYLIKNSEGEMPSEIDFTSGEKGPGGGMDAIFASMSDDEEGDELYGEAKKAVIEAGKASTSYLQRKLGVGYSRAAKLIDMLEERGVIGKGEGSKPREVIGAGNADELVARAEAADQEREGEEKI